MTYRPKLIEVALPLKRRRIQDGIFHPEEFGNAALQFLVNILGSANETDRGHAESVGFYGLDGCLRHFGVTAQAEVIVRAIVEQFVLDSGIDHRPLWRCDDPFFLVQTGIADALNFFLKGGFDV